MRNQTMGQWITIKKIVRVIFLMFILSPSAELLAGLSEPGVLVYGQVRDSNGELVLSGTLTWTITPEGSDTPMIETSVQLGEIDSNNIQYSYRFLLGMETPMAGHDAGDNAIQLAESDASYQWTAGVEALGISISGTFDLGYGDCGTGRNITIDARPIVDGDEDGLPDDWEALYDLATNSGDGDDGPDGDPDHDGLTNLEEYLGELNPTVANITTPNTSPTTPSLNSPAQGTEISSNPPSLSVNNAQDPDDDVVTYEFEVYDDESLCSLVFETWGAAEGVNVTNLTLEESLPDNAFYFWRARAFDGEEYSPWTDVAMFFLNTENDAPGVPVLNYPRDGSEVSGLQPTLVAHTASDPDLDTLSHEFAVFADADLTTMVAGPGIMDHAGAYECSWTVDSELTDGEIYYWSARAVDDEGAEGDWAVAYTFNLNTSNHTPSKPAIVSPGPGEEVNALPMELTVSNGLDSDGDTLYYEFQMDCVNTFNSRGLETSGLVDEAAGGETSWSPTSDLTDNTTYYWRVCVFDGGTYSAWIQGSFFVNTVNNAPTIPVLLNPGNGSSVPDLIPELSVIPARDEDRDDLTYDYQVFSNISLVESSLVFETHGAATSWTVTEALGNRTEYVWRARAVDEHGLAGLWSEASSFTVNANTRPSAPVLNNPVSGGVVTSLTPSLSVRNAVDPDGDALYYDFELYSDSSLENLVDTGLVGEDQLITSWRVSVTLSDGSAYYWRARAYDGILEGAWTTTSAFSIQTQGAETVVNPVASVDVIADSTDDQVVGVTDETSPINGVAVTIPPGALSEDCTVTIGWVENPPALPDQAVVLGHVLEFGPHGLVFNNPVTIKIPYTQKDLEVAGVSDPAELSVMTFNATTLTWDSVSIDSVDTEGGYLVISIDHFSLYTKTYLSNIGSSNGSGGCFINTVEYMVSERLYVAAVPVFFILLSSVVVMIGYLSRKRL